MAVTMAGYLQEGKMRGSKPVNEGQSGKDALYFYYNRDERLEKASERVRALYANAPRRHFSLLSSLTDSKPKAALFVSIIVMCLMILFVTYLVPHSGTALAGNRVTAQAMRFNGSCFIVLKKEIAGSSVWQGPVDVAVSNPDLPETRTFSRQIVFTSEKIEEFRWSVPFEAHQLFFFLQCGNETISFRIFSE
jgi:hypothetical protein